MDTLEKRMDIALFEAKRFITKVTSWKERLRSDNIYSCSKEGGAAKRSSLDLTRALAEIRKP